MGAIVALTLVGTAVALLTNQPSYYVVLALVVAPLVGAVNMHQATVERMSAGLRAAQDEIRQLAAVAERERIARDLHDVLGHTLSLIVIKSELASKLADRDTLRAVAEIRDVERVARAALDEVRAAVRGYRALLPEEIERARSLLDAAAIESQIDVPALSLTRPQEAALALAVREGITNVVRHARASVAEIHLAAASEGYVLEIRDDGCGGDLIAEGAGLRGMRARIQELGGSVHLERDAGTRLVVRLPRAAA
jgi:two-component system sensor histidine kinase DesK